MATQLSKQLFLPQMSDRRPQMGRTAVWASRYDDAIHDDDFPASKEAAMEGRDVETMVWSRKERKTAAVSARKTMMSWRVGRYAVWSSRPLACRCVTACESTSAASVGSSLTVIESSEGGRPVSGRGSMAEGARAELQKMRLPIRLFPLPAEQLV